jgi:hypothetical protein
MAIHCRAKPKKTLEFELDILKNKSSLGWSDFGYNREITKKHSTNSTPKKRELIIQSREE